jgi:single-stranded-DNA-specific exonuclease
VPVSKHIHRRVCSAEESLAHLHPVLSRIYAARNVKSPAQLERSLDRLLAFGELKGIAAAAELLADAIQNGQRILIVGDFDADGATSSALAVRALRRFGAAHVDFLVPNRFAFGYGLTPEIVAVAAQRRPDVLITVDNGISSVDGVRAANAHGMRVVVTDHHLAGAELPEAAAIVNPNQPGDAFPSKSLAGVGVCFYVMLAVRAALRERGWFAARGMEDPNLAQLLDLVALGTVADVVPLDHNNRILVAQGIARIRSGKCCPGIAALFKVAGRAIERAQAGDLGFVAAPRLNAAGRMEDMSLGIECLLADDPDRALELARRLDQLNRERRAVEEEMKLQAHETLRQMRFDSELPLGVSLFDPGWHQGVIGILAARIKDHLHRPVIAFAPGNDGEIKGSARSVPGLHIRDVLDAVATRHPGLLQKFGGHAMAAGLTLKRADFAAFSEAFDAEVRRHLDPDDLRGVIHSDGELNPQDVNVEVAELIRNGGPWGQGFPEPVFDGEFELVQRRIVGEKHLKMVLRAPGNARAIDAIAFNTADADWPPDARRVQAAFRLDVNEYQGRKSAQLIMEYVRPVPAG